MRLSEIMPNYKLSRPYKLNESNNITAELRNPVIPVSTSDGVKARAPKAKTKAKAIGIKAKANAKAVVHKAKAKAHKAKDKAKDMVINRDQGLRQGHDEPTQYHVLWRKYLPVTNSVY